MNIDPFLAWVESTALSQWVVGSPSMFAFPGILTLHAIGMGFAVGISAAIDLRILGVAPKVPLRELRRFLPILWAGFWLNAVSGVLLLIGYPTKALTNPVFYLKLTLIAVAMVLLVRISRQVFATGSGASLSPRARPADLFEAAQSGDRIAHLLGWSDHRRTATRLHVPSAHPVALTMHDFQIWLVTTIGGRSAIADVMRTAWAWPIAESLHFLGLCLLIGAVGSFDLRLLGVGRRIPIAAMHRFIPWGLLGFAINITTGTLFILTEPDQYIYNPSFHFKLLFMTIGGLNAATFYLTSYRRVFGPDAPLDAPRRAKVIAAISLCAWIGVITGGRLLTFYRPSACEGQQTSLLLTCAP